MSDDYVLTCESIVEYEVLVRAVSKEHALKKAEAGDILMEEVVSESSRLFDDEILTQYEYLERKGELDDE